MPFREAAWKTYRRIADRYPVVRKVMGPLRWYYHYNYVSYALHRVVGVSYREWYARTLDSLALPGAPPLVGLEERMGRYQLDYLRKRGLLPGHSLLDFGCGYVRAGVHLIPYLDPGCYVGADVSRGRLEQGQRQIERLGLAGRRPELIWIPDLDLKRFGGRKFDFIWSHGVLSHMPPGDVETFFHNLSTLMHPNSVYLGNYTATDSGDVEWATLRHVYYSHQFLERICARAGLKMERLPDWVNGLPHEASEHDELVRITLA